MKKILLIVALIATFSLSCMSCSTSTYATNDVYQYQVDDNVVVVGDTCYVYYTNPTTTFLNTLYIIDGAYYYYHLGRYIHVVFPYWETWSPYRYFYYNNGIWSWRWRSGYSYMHHYNYHHYNRWVDYRQHRNHYNHRPNFDYRYRPHGGNHTVRPHGTTPNHRPNVNNHRPMGNHGGGQMHRQPSISRPQSQGSWRGRH